MDIRLEDVWEDYGLDGLQQKTAATYLDGLYHVRELIVADELACAAQEQAYLHALWQHEAHWLNFLLDHHHTRDVESALRHLATTLEERERIHALLAMDELIDALEEVAQRDVAVIENIL
jgi:hypothetical protein